MAIDESFADRVRRKRREDRIDWTEEDERRWLKAHPDDEPILAIAEDGEDWSQYAPDFEEDVSPESLEVDNFLSNLDIIDAYNRWAGKGQVSNPGQKTEGIMIRCPNPTHVDRNPSAWINTDKQVYSCGGCGMEGGDIYVIAAYAFGYPVPIPRARFPELKKKMAESLGYHVTQVGSKKYVQPIPKSHEPKEDAAEDADPPRERMPFPRKRQNSDEKQDDEDDKTDDTGDDDDRPLAAVHSITPPPEDDMPILKWQPLVHSGTFLDQWMGDTTTDHLPEEYYFWLGLAAVGLAAKDRAILRDRHPVKGNLFICLTGITGVGKSQSVQKFEQLLREAVPEGTAGKGVRILSVPSSGESLIDSFNEIYTKDMLQSDGTYAEQVYRHKIAGLINFKELSVLIGRSSYAGSTMKPLLLEFFDAYGDVTNISRTHGKSEAREPYATVIATTQPESIRHLLSESDTESGFLNRWAFVGGEPQEPDVFDDEIFDPRPSAEKLKEIANRYNVISEDDPPIKHEWEQEARDHFRHYHHTVLWPMKQEEGRDLYSRCDLMIKKLAFLLMLDRRLDNVDLDCIMDAIQLWEYMEDMYDRIGANIGLGEFDACKVAIRKAINDFHRRHGHGPKPQQFMAMMNRDHKKFSSKLIDEVLSSMERNREVIKEPFRDRDGNPTERYANADLSS